jgi:lipoprotein signal peptidase
MELDSQQIKKAGCNVTLRGKLVLFYSMIAFSILIVDRITKSYALEHVADIVINRGFSWGIFDNSSIIPFMAVTAITVIATAALLIYTIGKAQNCQCIVGEILIIAGSCSNIIDRFFYGGVIDFIGITIGQWAGPVFNIADCAITAGVLLLFVDSIRINNNTL